MEDMTMWIILGVLIAIVAAFLVVSTVLDKKRNKKAKIEQVKLEKEIKFSGFNAAKEIVKIVKENEKLLKNFVPSIGELKMSDINLKAKKSLTDVKNSYNMSLIMENTDNQDSKVFVKHFESLIKEKSNNWTKKNKEAIAFFAKYKKPPLVEEDQQKTKKTWSLKKPSPKPQKEL